MAGKQTLFAFASLAVLLSAGSADADEGQEETSDEAEPTGRLPTGRFEIGAGFTSDESFIARAGVYQDDLFGTGNALSLTARLSARSQLFLMRFTDPDVLDSDVIFNADVYNRSQTWSGFTRQGAGGSITLGKPIAANTRLFLSYRLENVVLEPETDHSGDPFYQGGLLSSLRLSLSHDTRDDPLFPTRGGNLGAYAEVSDRRLGSDIEVARAGAWMSRHGRVVGPLALHVRGGVDVVLPRAGDVVPLSERLQLAGHRDIRGYGIGTVDPLGGNVKLTWQSELELPIARSIGLSAVAFFDAGAVWDLDHRGCQVALAATAPVNPCRGGSLLDGLRESVGFGLVWRSPIGPLRFDWAFPLDRAPGQSAMEFLFSVGGVF